MTNGKYFISTDVFCGLSRSVWLFGPPNQSGRPPKATAKRPIFMGIKTPVLRFQAIILFWYGRAADYSCGQLLSHLHNTQRQCVQCVLFNGRRCGLMPQKCFIASHACAYSDRAVLSSHAGIRSSAQRWRWPFSIHLYFCSRLPFRLSPLVPIPIIICLQLADCHLLGACIQ